MLKDGSDRRVSENLRRSVHGIVFPQCVMVYLPDTENRPTIRVELLLAIRRRQRELRRHDGIGGYR